MPAQLISYDLRKPGRNYSTLHDAIKGLGTWWHGLESVWIVDTVYSCAQIRDHLKQYIDTNDDIVVLTLKGNWATSGLEAKYNDWLRENLAG